MFGCSDGPGPTLIIMFQEQHQQESQSSAIKTTLLVSCNDGPGATLIMMLASRPFLCGPRTDVTVTLKLNYKTYQAYLESCRTINKEKRIFMLGHHYTILSGTIQNMQHREAVHCTTYTHRRSPCVCVIFLTPLHCTDKSQFQWNLKSDILNSDIAAMPQGSKNKSNPCPFENISSSLHDNCPAWSPLSLGLPSDVRYEDRRDNINLFMQQEG